MAIFPEKISPRENPEHKTKIDYTRYTIFLRGTFKNGKLNGLVQAFGQFTINPEGRCFSKVDKKLAFVGHFENGIPKGPCFRSLTGESYLYSENCNFTGRLS